jgi:hypothetical protein
MVLFATFRALRHMLTARRHSGGVSDRVPPDLSTRGVVKR